MKKILYLSFYFEPDLCAGSFRNTPLVKELAKQAQGLASVDVITTLPNRYNSFEANASTFEERMNYNVTRIAIPQHNSGMRDQVLSFIRYYREVCKLVKGKKYDLVVASSSRLFTAFLGYRVAKKDKTPLYLDVRDIFFDSLEDILSNGIIKAMGMPLIKYVEKKTFKYASHINLISEGFKPYFQMYSKCHFSYYPNGIDRVFIDANLDTNNKQNIQREIKTIVYAGNIGEGQGLHKIIPQAAIKLEGKVKFIVIGDGGAKGKLLENLEKFEVNNVELRPPVKREELINIYKNADFLFVHLNNFKAFEKVLPSKLFELATFPIPIIAGVSGFAAAFVSSNIANTILFDPCDVDGLVSKLQSYKYRYAVRDSFIEKFQRDNVNRNMAETILQYIS